MDNASIDTLIRGKGLKVTAQRRVILGFLIRSAMPLSIEEVRENIGASANPVTVYRVLEQFVRAGLVYQTDFRSGKAYFEYQKSSHHHIVCTECGMREEVEVCVQIDENELADASKQFANVTSHALEFFGVCKHCAESKK